VTLNILFLVYSMRRLGQFFEERTKVIAKTRKMLTRKSKLLNRKSTTLRNKPNEPEVHLDGIEMLGATAPNPLYVDGRTPGGSSSKQDDEVEILIDEETGDRYSHNTRTGATTWLDSDDEGGAGGEAGAYPDAFYAEAEDAKVEEGEAEEEEGLAWEGEAEEEGKWERHLDAESGDWFESNTVTDEVRWLEGEAAEDETMYAEFQR